MELESFLNERKKMIDQALEKLTPPENTFPPTIHKAIRYSLLNGGKRIRPILTLTVNELVGGNYKSIIPFACGIEVIHTYSLIHDDLPVMDNSDFRRGKASSHKVFGEATALLAGDGLLTLAFQIMTDPTLCQSHNPLSILKSVNLIAQAAGLQGMIGGQTVDIETQGKKFALPLLEYIHTHKTGALIVAAVRAGAILGESTEEELDALTEYGKKVGLAFQIIDDILDVESSEKILGKETGMDSAQGKATYPQIFGLQESRERAETLVEKAEQTLGLFDHSRAKTLKRIARHICERIQ